MIRQALKLLEMVELFAGSHLQGVLAAETSEINPGPSLVPIELPDEVSSAQGLLAWQKIFKVVSHPRCINCHVDESNIPMWSGPSFGNEPKRHGMNIQADESRIGAQTLNCVTCHQKSLLPNTLEHAPPHTNHDWMLAPVEFAWFGKSSNNICQQMRDPERNGGRDGAGLVEHIIHDIEIQAFIAWSFDPGGNREPAPGTLQQHLDDMALWTTAGMPCPND